MKNFELCSIFENLQRGQQRTGWDHSDYAEHQILSDGDTMWARRIDEDGHVGDWVGLPPPVAGHG